MARSSARPIYTGAAALDDVNYAVTLPFAFQFDGAPYTNIFVNTNGNLTFGTTAPVTTNYTALSSATANGAVAAFGRDLFGRAGSSAPIA